MDYLVNLNLNKNELQNAVIQPLAADPGSPKAGQIYYHSTNKKLYIYNGTSWVPVGTDQVQADWNQTTTTAVDFIKNKPTITDEKVKVSGYDGTSSAESFYPILAKTTEVGSTAYVRQASNEATINISNAETELLLGGGSSSTIGLIYLSHGNGNYTILQADSNAESDVSITFPNLDGTLITDNDLSLYLENYIPESIGTAKGDLLYFSSSATPTRLAVGSAGQVLGVTSGIPAWQNTVSAQSGITSSATGLTQAKAVYDFVTAQIDALPEPMIFKGTLGTGGTITSLPTAAAANEGFTYKVITAGTYASQAAKVGDLFISNGSAWNWVPSGDEPSGTVTNVATGTGLTGGPITTSGTISLDTVHSTAPGAKGDTSNQTPAFGGTFKVPSLTVDVYGRVTAAADHTVTIPTLAASASYNSGTTVGSVTINGTATTFKIPDATQSAGGLMSATDKTTLDNLEAASQGAITYTTLTIASGATSVSATGVASKLITYQAYQGGEAVIVDYDGTDFSIASAAASAITIKCVVTV